MFLQPWLPGAKGNIAGVRRVLAKNQGRDHSLLNPQSTEGPGSTRV